MINKLIERVLQGESPRNVLRSVVSEADQVPSWSPGQPVPDGYRVVFGKLVSIDNAKAMTGKHSGAHANNFRDAHKASTAAWDATAKANKSGSKDDHFEAAKLHHMAMFKHGSAKSTAQTWDKSQHRDAASDHRDQAETHGFYANKQG